MKDHLIRVFAISISSLLLAASVGVIVWIARDEQSRLVERERSALEAAERASREEQQAMADGEGAAEDVEKAFHDIDTLLSGLSLDEISEE